MLDVAGLGHVAQHVEHQRIVEAAHLGLEDGAAVVRIEAAGLGVGRHRLDRRPAERRHGDRETGRRDHRRFVEAKAEAGRRRIGRHAHVAAVLGPIHRPDVDRRLAVELLQPFPGQADDLLDRHRRLQAERDRRRVDALAVKVEVGRHAFEPARAVEHAGCQATWRASADRGARRCPRTSRRRHRSRSSSARELPGSSEQSVSCLQRRYGQYFSRAASTAHLRHESLMPGRPFAGAPLRHATRCRNATAWHAVTAFAFLSLKLV